MASAASPSAALPPLVPPKVPPPPPPPAPPRRFPPHLDTQRGSTRAHTVVPVSPASARPHRRTLSTAVSPASPSRSARRPAGAPPRSRTTSVDYGAELDDGADDEAFEMGEHRVLVGDLAAGGDTDKDLPLLVADDDGGDASSDEELLGPPRRRKKRRRERGGAAQQRWTATRWVLVVGLSCTAGAVVLVAVMAWLVPDSPAASRAGELAQGAKDKVGWAVEQVKGWVGGKVAGAPAGTDDLDEDAGEEDEAWVQGKDGDTVRMRNGDEFVYRNPFGGTFDSDPNSLAARAQNDTPPLSEEWDFLRMRMRGVNLGGWLSLEPFITSHLFEPFLEADIPAEDEYTLSLNLRKAGTLERTLRQHYDTFITEKDFATIAGAGLNWIRLPIPYWAIRTWDDEPFLEHVAWEYVLKAIEWARKYGLRINLDLHSVPGSQNGWNHSGRLGSISFLHSTLGLANAQRTLDYIAALAEFTSRRGVREVVPMYSVINEPMLAVLGEEALRGFYLKAYETIRNITGYGPGKGPFLALHDGFKGTRRWYHFLDTAPGDGTVRGDALKGSTDGLDRVALDSHRYLAFAEPDLRSVREQVLKPCSKWAAEYNKTMLGFGVAISGEFSLGVTDCGRFLNNVFQGTRLEGTFPNATSPMYPPSASLGTCEYWEDYEQWTDEFKEDLKDLTRAQMDTFQNWFYWTWRTLPSTLHLPHLAANALWSYSLGLEQGWIPRDPREGVGFCDAYRDKVGAEDWKHYVVQDDLVEGWKVGRAAPPFPDLERRQDDVPATPTAGQDAPYTFGRIPPEAAERDSARWPPLEFDVPSLGFNGGGMRTAPLLVYERTGDAPVLRSPRGAEAGRDIGRKWAVPRKGCEYPQDRWRVPDEVVEGAQAVKYECTAAAALERGDDI
ncbi:uncharacterized protein JCM10292_001836 [Rhodotorula paludigena]|uniref:uncharacterized protein n=1 Tax=Rhodotorula paludigena TaxID=86838 RepID=UPI0031790F38